MYRLSIIDEKQMISDNIKRLKIWEERKEFQIIKTIGEDYALDFIKENYIEIVFISMYNHCHDKLKYAKHLIEACKQTYFVFVCENYHFQNVRDVFRIGAFDYLRYPLNEEDMADTLRRIEKNYYLRFIPASILSKIDVLIDNIFSCGGFEHKICSDIIEEIYGNNDRGITEKQILIENIKEKIYLDMIYKKPWLEKFVWSKSFIYKQDFHIEEEKLIIKAWERDFTGVANIIKKYGVLDNKLIYNIGKHIIVHVDEKITLDDLSKSVYLNKSYISHIFKKVSGMSVKEFMVDVKMDRAKILLMDKDRKIYEISEQLGYNDVEYFRKKFKDVTGISPTDFRNS
ncbi:MAG: helix-turn-helix domain-containing protein [Erysipelotrichales bacterium]|nr:helix-turn-helix domain-containing protein [Erysipelotrichales bacterium]